MPRNKMGDPGVEGHIPAPLCSTLRFPWKISFGKDLGLKHLVLWPSWHLVSSMLSPGSGQEVPSLLPKGSKLFSLRISFST